MCSTDGHAACLLFEVEPNEMLFILSIEAAERPVRTRGTTGQHVEETITAISRKLMTSQPMYSYMYFLSPVSAAIRPGHRYWYYCYMYNHIRRDTMLSFDWIAALLRWTYWRRAVLRVLCAGKNMHTLRLFSFMQTRLSIWLLNEYRIAAVV